MRIGNGFDIHKFGGKKPIFIGGVHFPYKKGILSHSDGDVLFHSVVDAILGATAMGDIGHWFPNSDENYKNISSQYFLKKVWKFTSKNYIISNLDSTIIVQDLKISAFTKKIRENLAINLDSKIERISIKSTTTEKLGFIGRNEGIACLSSVLLIKRIR